MKLLRIKPAQKIALAITTGLVIILGAWFLREYLILIALSAVVALLFNPLYQWMLKKGRKPGTAAWLTFLASVITVVIPLFLIGTITVYQIERLVDNVSKGGYTIDATAVGQQAVDNLNQFFEKYDIPITLSLQGITAALSSAAEQFGKNLLQGIFSSIGSFFSFFTLAIIYVYVFISMLIQQKTILRTMKNLNPLGDKISELYIAKASAMTKATVRGQFIIAIIQGTLSAIALSIAGLSDLFFFFWVLLTILSVVPLGAGIVTIPIGIAMILTGNVWQGALVILNHLLIVTNVDNILRPRLVPAEAKLDPALMILAVFAGLGIFGFIGIVLGPVIMILIVTTIQMYLEVFHDTKSLSQPTTKLINNNRIRSLAFWKKA